MHKTLWIILGSVIGIVLVVWLGAKISPKPFSGYSESSGAPRIVLISADLPEPVEKFYQEIYGENIPVIESFIISGRGNLRFMGITLPARLRFTHDAGKGYRHYIETTFWGLPVIRVNEHYLNWESRLELPFGVVENEPQVDQAANLGLWSETLMFPSVYLTATGVRWEAIDGTTARLVVPFIEDEDEFIVYFDEETYLIDRMEAMRWKEAGDAEKTLWQAQALEWGEVQGLQMPVVFAAQWMDEDSPWLIARIEDVVWNVEIAEYIQSTGE